MEQSILEMRGIRKAFDENSVLKDVDFTLKKGEIHALIGENGAGKSTLMNILGGVIEKDEGEILLEGTPLHISSPRDAIKCGIAFIHQELNLINDMPAYENIFLGQEVRTKHGFVDHSEMKKQTRLLFDRLGLSMKPEEEVGTMEAGYKQMVEIARALRQNARIIIMDEPTTSLTGSEIDLVFSVMKKLTEQGVSIIFISHKLDEVKTFCDRFTVLRDGRVVESGNTENVEIHDLAQMMVGHAVRSERLNNKEITGAELLRVENLCGEGFRNICFTLSKGEILGFTGLLGDGRSELFRTIIGDLKPKSGKIYLNGKKVGTFSVQDARSKGIGYLPRDRKENGIIKDLSVLDNGTVVTLSDYKSRGLLSEKAQVSAFNEQKERLHIKMSDTQDKITGLSGGNQQKVVLAKWLAANPQIMIFDNPTQGVDVGAKEEIYDSILQLSRQGVGVVILSSEAQEIIRLCSRAVVMAGGEIVKELLPSGMTEKRIMLYATGGREE